MNRSVTAEMHQISTSPCTEFMSGETFYRSSINSETKPTSSEIAYSNQSTRTLTTTPLCTYIVAIVTSG